MIVVMMYSVKEIFFWVFEKSSKVAKKFFWRTLDIFINSSRTKQRFQKPVITEGIIAID